GIALRDVRTGAELHAGWPRAEDGQAFPMMSVYKVPIAVAVLAADAMGTLSLSDTVEFRPSDVRGFHSPLSERYPDGGVRLTVDELLEFAVSQSDNAASDRLLSLVGGPEGVSDRLRRLEVQGVRVDRPERELTFDLLGLEGEVRGREMNRAQWNALTSSVPDAQAA